MSSEEVDLVWREIERINTCMMVTVRGGELRARPMTGKADRDRRAIWFVSGRNRENGDLQGEPAVCLAYADLSQNTFVSILGRASVTEDPVRLNELVTARSDEAWSPMSMEEDAMVIRVTPEVGELWDDPQADVLLALRALTATQGSQSTEAGPAGRQVRM